VPVRGDDALFERVCLEAFQSGLSWITILRKRPAFRAAFADFSIDAVAAFDRYHGDFGRTVIVGEPHPALMRAVDAAGAANAAVAQRLGPGMRYSDVMAIGREAVARTGVQAFTPSSPHSVGLYHTDEAFENDSLMFAKADHAIRPGMVLSVDCPVLLTDIGGTVHMEDMWLITDQGCEPLNDTSDPFIRL